ncbi:RRXRR domain-containing protein [Anabaena cylindrica FACHB-243]|uniref:HNH endonuclease n=1 Tax=Anabaena cylindrica (strain ATCC 27899 / PCC 7122) TaxID=272123 RepID=K9ZRN7_ANACC|nr:MULTISPECIES: RNA-guided endonuclease IscB [Anabaena]AFZ61040.1 HNH endonuclease [Anabaena cylindrica PCC 7122]MBD2421756.1 RRXRR domain-containing protein [Anabaena cylindrica FACHB-243]MBY5281497.1 HNH endonuclease [Anabaena sp. CCAP 1446/1C]MBY5309557.1 HNH endonuclease [Anabaena sp. CCAP 1446/1C]MCM2408968.1 RNA-guided endonuclease IscB [Anabaena sp. CCAP 1446/1C]
MSKVFVLDTNFIPLNPIHSAQARQLLRNKKAAIFRQFPFTIILKESRPDSPVSSLRLKIDPGAKFTGMALVNDSTGEVVFAAELKHRGFAIRDALTSRRQLRRSRRARKTRYRQPRFLNRTRPEGWLAPSLQSRIENIKTWVKKLRQFAPIGAISQELVRFDMQLMANPDLQGREYQQGTLAGYETREYLLEKWDRQCAYCGVKDVPFQVEHIHPRAKGGSDSITNLTLSCEKCNTKKGTKDIKDFLKKDPSRLEKILKQAKRPLADAASVNTTRLALLKVLKATGLPVETGSGGLTKFNRSQQKLEKTHWIDAACVGQLTPILNIKGVKPLLITANGHGTRQSCRTDKYGFPSRYVPRFKFVNGFQTGDIVKAVVTKGKKIGAYIGRVAVRTSGSFNISTVSGLIQGISYKYCKSIHKKDGYEYGK